MQGFVYRDPGHRIDRFHNYSGWELHPLTAWRISPGTSNRALSLAAIEPAGQPAPYGVDEDADGR